MSRSIHSELKDFSNIYKLQERGESFKTVPDMLRAMGGERFCNEITVSSTHTSYNYEQIIVF